MACDTLGNVRIRAFTYKFWGIFWIGWVMEKRFEPAPLYYDDNPYVTLYADKGISYATVGFTHDGVLGRVKKYVEKVLEEEKTNGGED